MMCLNSKCQKTKSNKNYNIAKYIVIGTIIAISFLIFIFIIIEDASADDKFKSKILKNNNEYVIITNDEHISIRFYKLCYSNAFLITQFKTYNNIEQIKIIQSFGNKCHK